MRKRKKNIFPIVAILLVAAAFLAEFIYVRGKENKRQAELSALSSQFSKSMQDLWSQKTALEAELNELDAETEASYANRGSAIIVFTDLMERLESDITTIMDVNGFPAVICIGTDYFEAVPGDVEYYDPETDDYYTPDNYIRAEDMLSEDVIANWLDKGWELAITVDGNIDIEALYRHIQDIGLPAPTCVYAGSHILTVEQIQCLENLGLSTFIQYSVQENGYDEDSVNYLTAYGSYDSGVKDALQTTVDESGCMAITIGYHTEREMYKESNFTSMLNILTSYKDAGSLEVCTAAIAVDRLETVQELRQQAEEDRQERRDKLTAQLAEVEAQIAEISS